MSLRDRLLARPRPSLEHMLRVEDDTAARAALEEARRAATLAEIKSDPDEAKKAKRAADKAEEALRACYEPVTLRALPPRDFEALIEEHKPREGSDDKVWNLDTFPRGCFLACVEGDLTAEEWTMVMDTVLSEAELTDLCNAAIRVNVRAPEPHIPKDWMSTLNSS